MTTQPTLAEATPRRRSILTPVAYSEAMMPSLQLAKSSRAARRFAVALLVLLAVTICLMVFAPWQQSITGAGYVIAYAPRERQQILEATIEGRIFRWNEDLKENARVAAGDFIAEIRDLDDEYSVRLQSQLDNTSDILEASQKIVDATEGQLQAYKRVQTEIELAQNAYVQSATEKVTAAEQKLAIADAAIPQLQAAYNRAKDLHVAGNIALEKLQEIERKLLESQGKVKEETANVSAARAELLGKRSDRQAYIHKAEADVQYYGGALDKAKSEVAKANKEQTEMKSKVARQNTQLIIAPVNGCLVHLSANLGSQMVKKGDPICTIVPETKERAVQIWLNGNDAPLVAAGRHVRLQFEGWPAIQFAGWPSVAVGTFGGTVVSVDMVDNGKGKFRCQILPDHSETNPWPPDRFLRQGVRTNGWVLLDQVPLWFEVWRKLNGFPPTVDVNASPYATEKNDDSGKK
ncbi:MAG: HlyD family efflux transporter periplasmic adaptor subunit [Planctomycetota bacterium]|nr:HlyD family efflux transporter periplasmic adaptor subunit [Planctomycetota bacterium]